MNQALGVPQGVILRAATNRVQTLLAANGSLPCLQLSACPYKEVVGNHTSPTIMLGISECGEPIYQECCSIIILDT